MAGVLLDSQTRAFNPRFFIGATWPAEEDPAEGWYDWIFVDWPHTVLKSPSFFHFQSEHGAPWNPEHGWEEDTAIYFSTRWIMSLRRHREARPADERIIP